MNIKYFKDLNTLTLNNFMRVDKTRKWPQTLFCRRSSNVPKETFKSVQDMPGPRPIIPFIGTSWLYSTFGPYTRDTAITTAREDLLSKYGPIYKERLGGSYIVSLHNPQHIEHVMRLQGNHPMRVVNEANVYWRRKHPDLYNSVGLGDSNGEEWYKLRHQVAPLILKPGALSSFSKMFSKIADDFVAVVKRDQTAEENRALDVRSYLYRFGLEAIWSASLGFELGTLSMNPPEEARKLIPLSMDLFNTFAELSSSQPWWKLWPTRTFRKFCSSEEEVFRITSNHTKQIISEIERENTTVSNSDGPLLQRFLANKQFDVRDVNTVIVDFIIAGIPTTSYYLSLLLHRIGQEKELQTRIQTELDFVIRDRNSVLDDSVLNSLPVLVGVIKEGFRLTTIIPGIMKMLPEDIICDQFRIPAYTPIVCQTRAASRSDKYFSLPNEFIPDRWIKNLSTTDPKILELQKQAKENKFLVLPFGFGARMCVGIRLAQKEITVLLAKIFLNFTIESVGEVELANYFIIGPKSPVRIKFSERK